MSRSKKNVHFSPNVTVFEIPIEDRRNYALYDALRFKDRIRKVEKMLLKIYTIRTEQ